MRRRARRTLGEAPAEPLQVRHLDGPEAVITLAQTLPRHESGLRLLDHLHRVQQRQPEAWSGGRLTVTEAANLSRVGVDVDFARDAAASVTRTLAPGTRVRVAFAVAGGAPSVPRVLTNRPDAMRRIVRRPSPPRVARVAFSITVSHGVSGVAIKARGRAILGAVDAIARAGFMVEVFAFALQEEHPGTRRPFGWTARLKSAGAPLDWQRLAYWATHPSALRVLGLAAQAAFLSDITARTVNPGFGAANLTASECLPAMPPGAPVGALIPSATSDAVCFALNPATLAHEAIAAASR